MSDKSLDSLEQGSFKKEPRKIPGLNNQSTQESMGGNAGGGSLGVNATYKESGKDILFDFGSTPDLLNNPDRVIFKIKLPDNIREIMKAGPPYPPTLIEDVFFKSKTDQAKEDLVRRKATEHNQAMVLDYLRNGGSFDLIPKTLLSPELEELQRKYKV